MFKQFRNSRLLRHKEAMIKASGLFSEMHYRHQLGHDSYKIRNAIRHYLMRGEQLGLSPTPLFDKEWYIQEYQDVAASVRDLFFHYVEYGEIEGRSPHPLFDPAYYQRQSNEKIERPLTHFVLANGRSGLDPHPLFKVDRFINIYGEVMPKDANPLIYFIEHAECEEFISDVFQGRHYACELGEPYDWPKHSVVQFIRRAWQESVSPHPDFDIDFYLRINKEARSPGKKNFVHFFFSGMNGFSGHNVQQKPLRGEKISQNFDGSYLITPILVDRTDAPAPRPVTAMPTQRVASSISERYADTQKNLNGKFRLDQGFQAVIANVDLPVVSILMPVYKPPLIFLDRAIRSVIQQSFSNWELCIVDDCSDSADLTALLLGYAQFDARIKVATAARNGGISRASNAALSFSTGKYIALLDNDDMLTVDAVETMTRAIMQDPALDFLYSDECLIDENDLTVRLFSKPDWSPTFLYACMYSGHFTAYRKSLVEKVGGFRSEFDFSQDYDLALRVSRTSPRVQHLQAYLYGWRMIAGSAAQGGKPFARLTNVAALQDALEQSGYPGTALGYPTTNVVARRRTVQQPKISIVIPSDNLGNIITTVKSIADHTDYPDFEILVVTNSKLSNDISQSEIAVLVKCVPYDLPFNFSDKCNAGASAATGEYIVFYNDDVRVISSNWIHSLLDIAVLAHVGAVAPKLLYEDGLIQHAGMVTGVRRLVGTAFHTYPSETSDHFGMAQYAREVSLLCGACIMLKTDVFRRIGGFDARNSPINHSDVDLCFRVRELGLACIYVPTAALKHIGHVSIGEVESKAKPNSFKRDKADIFLLKRWIHEVAYDPYFPPPMRDILFKDNQELFQIYPGENLQKKHLLRNGRDVLLVTHDLTNSGAPKIILDLASLLAKIGDYVCVLSPTDGPMRKRLTDIGIDVVVDELALTRHASVFDFAKNFDLAIANTVVTYPFVKQLGSVLPVYWYIHESELVDHFVNVHSDFLEAFPEAASIWVGSSKSGRHVSRHGIDDFEIVPYGVDDAMLDASVKSQMARTSDSIVVGLFGSFEPRKGQDLAVLGLLSLSEMERTKFELRLFGRVLDQVFETAVKALAGDEPCIIFKGELTSEEYLEEVSDVDIIIVPSRDDTLPLVSLDALAASKILIVSRTTGTSEWLEHNRSALILEHNSPDEIGKVLRCLEADRSQWSSIGSVGREVFEQSFSWDSFVLRVSKLLESPINKK